MLLLPDHGDNSREEQCCQLGHSRGFLKLKARLFM
jgi:hypothetical protein